MGRESHFPMKNIFGQTSSPIIDFRSMNDKTILVRQIRLLLLIFIIGLVFSGITAIPLETELRLLTKISEKDDPRLRSGFSIWLNKVCDGLVETDTKYPFMPYGTDWLAFAHFVIAIVFVGPLRDPVKNIWVVEFGMIACVLVIPFALIMGSIREIPLGWQLIDCSFGVLGIIPLWFCHRQIRKLKIMK